MLKTYVSSNKFHGFVKTSTGWEFAHSVSGIVELLGEGMNPIHPDQIKAYSSYPTPEEISGMLGCVPDDYWINRFRAKAALNSK